MADGAWCLHAIMDRFALQDVRAYLLVSITLVLPTSHLATAAAFDEPYHDMMMVSCRIAHTIRKQRGRHAQVRYIACLGLRTPVLGMEGQTGPPLLQLRHQLLLESLQAGGPCDLRCPKLVSAREMTPLRHHHHHPAFTS